MIGDTTQSTSTFGSSLEDEKKMKKKEKMKLIKKTGMQEADSSSSG